MDASIAGRAVSAQGPPARPGSPIGPVRLSRLPGRDAETKEPA